MTRDKRHSERLEILGDLHGELLISQPMAIKEIGGGGAQVETTFSLQLNSLHEVRLTLGDRTVVLKARVAHCRIGDVDNELVVYRSGLEFVEPSDHATTVIVEFVEGIRSGRMRV